MRKRLTIVASAVLTIVLIAGGVRAVTGQAGSRAADGNPAIDGNWTGKLTMKVFDMTGGNRTESQKGTFDMTVTQDGADITINITVTDDNQSADSYTLTGKVGNNTFWATGPDTEDNKTLTMGGTIFGRNSRIKGTAFITENEETIEAKFSGLSQL